MNHRDSPIIAYYNRIEKNIYCRLCINYTHIPHLIVFGDTCMHQLRCCSSGIRPVKFTTKYWKYDNTNCDIVISEDSCKMCTYHEGRCLVDAGNTCPFNIPEYTRDFAELTDTLRRDK